MKKLIGCNYEITNRSCFSNFVLHCSVDKMTDYFGHPSLVVSSDHKIQLEWVFYKKFKKDYQCITIYDWKEHSSIYDIKNWHVGSKNLKKEEIIQFFTDHDANDILKEYTFA